MKKKGALVMKESRKNWHGFLENCDICRQSLINYKYFVGGCTKLGSWALMCPSCFIAFGTGLGVGRGQKYNTETKEKVAG